MTSNVDRSLFNMHKLERKTQRTRLLATYSQSFNIKSTKLVVIYYPKVDKHNQPAIFYDDEAKKNLQKVYRDN